MSARKLLIALLTTLIVGLVPGAAMADSETTTSEEITLNLIQSGEYQAPQQQAPVQKGPRKAPVVSGLSANEEEALKARLSNGMLNYAENISLEDLQINVNKVSMTDLQALIEDLINSNPDLFYVSASFGVDKLLEKDSSGTYVPTYYYQLQPSYSYPISDIPSMKTKYENALASVLKWVPANASDMQKAKAVHDWLVRNCSYNTNAANKGSKAYGSSTPWNAYGALVEKKPVCEGFSLAFSAAMSRLGIPCTYVSNWIDGEGHGWNRVQIDGSWYNLDVTWDNGYTGNDNFSTTPNTTFFLKSDSWFKKNQANGFHESWTPAGIAGTNTKYDNYTSWPTYSGPASNANTKPTSMSLSKSSLTMGVSEIEKLTISSVAPTTVNKALATWTSSNPEVVAVDSAGNLYSSTRVGTATITCALNGVSRTCAVTVKGGDVSASNIAKTLSYTTTVYNAASQRPTVTLTQSKSPSGTLTLVEGTDYTLSWSPSATTNVGTVTVTITGKGYYTGTATKTYKITPRGISETDISVANQTYTGNALTPNPAIAYNGKTLVKGTDYTVTYKNNTNAGTATATITGKGNYTGSTTKNFTIAQVSVVDGSVGSVSSYVYTGDAFKPTPVLTLNGKTLKAGTDFTYSYSNNANVGKATVTLTGKGNYTGKVEKSFDITQRSISIASVDTIPIQYYVKGKVSEPKVVLKYKNKTLVEGVDYEVVYTNNAAVGTAKATIIGKGNFNGSISKTFSIIEKPLVVSISSATVSGVSAKTYNGKNQTQNPTVKLGGKTLKNGTDYTISYKNNKNVGTATMSITGKGSYTGTKSITFKINAATPHVKYKVHRQTYGWEKDWKKDGQSSGTTGQSKRLEGIFINLDKGGLSGSIQYRVHVQTYGWAKKAGKPGTGWVNEGKMAGTTGESKRLEAIQIKLTGDMAKQYDIYYRVHAQKFGWMGWAKNGASAGTAGYSYRLEAIQIKLVKKGGKAPGSTANAFRQRN